MVVMSLPEVLAIMESPHSVTPAPLGHIPYTKYHGSVPYIGQTSVELTRHCPFYSCKDTTRNIRLFHTNFRQHWTRSEEGERTFCNVFVQLLSPPLRFVPILVLYARSLLCRRKARNWYSLLPSITSIILGIDYCMQTLGPEAAKKTGPWHAMIHEGYIRPRLRLAQAQDSLGHSVAFRGQVTRVRSYIQKRLRGVAANHDLPQLPDANYLDVHLSEITELSQYTILENASRYNDENDSLSMMG